MKHNAMPFCLVCLLLMAIPPAEAAPAARIAVRKALELAEKTSVRRVAGASVREAGEKLLERGSAKYGDKILAAAADGGLELIEAAAKHGDDVLRIAAEASPAARRVLGLNAEALLPLARRFGPEALELEARAPGIAGRIFAAFGDDAGKLIARSVPADDLPRLLAYAEKADSPATRKLLLETYRKEGPDIFKRLPPLFVIAAGLSASMLYGTHNLTRPVHDALASNPESVPGIVRHGLTIFGIVSGLVVLLLLWRFKLMPWHGTPAGSTSVSSSRKSGTF